MSLPKCLHFVLALSLLAGFQFAPAKNVVASNVEPPYIYAVYDSPLEQPQGFTQIQNTALFPPLQAPQSAYLVSSGNTAYTRLETLVVIYPDTAAGTLNSTDVSLIEQHIHDTATFVWRQSSLKFYIDLTILVIDDYKDISEFNQLENGGYWLNPVDNDNDGISVEMDLLNRGVLRDQYDSINYLWAHNNYTLPAAYGGLGGLIAWQLGTTGITENPIFQASGTPQFSTAFPHEMQHTIDFMLDSSGYPDYFHADRPWDYPGRFGEDWSYWVYEMRIWPLNDWLVLRAPWGNIQEAPDADGDGVPDEGMLPITEEALGSSTASNDSEGDGFSDLNEIMSGFFKNTGLNEVDLDGDFALDSNDAEPLYAVNTQIPEKTHALDGNPDDWDVLTDETNTSSAPLNATIYANWDSNFFYLMFIVDRYASIHFKIDANADGWFHGSDNYEVAIDPSYSNPNDPSIVGKARIWDSSEAMIAAKGYPMWDDDSNYPFERLLVTDDIGRYARSYGTGYLVQLAIPQNAQTGMVPKYLSQLGLRVTYEYLDRQYNSWAETFENDDLVYLTLWSAAWYPSGFNDTFDAEMLDLRWSWTDPQADSNYSLTADPGSLRLMTYTGGHDLYSNKNAPRLLQPVGKTFLVSTHVHLLPVAQEYQGAGLLVWQDDDNYIRLELKTGGDLRFIYSVNGNYTDLGNLPLNAQDVYLKIVRSNQNFSAWYSRDNNDWLLAGSIRFNAASTVYTGVHLINEWQNNPLQADFDYVEFDWSPSSIPTPPPTPPPSYDIYIPIITR